MTATALEWTAIAERAEKDRRPNWALDEALLIACGWRIRRVGRLSLSGRSPGASRAFPPNGGGTHGRAVPKPSSSCDAILALIAESLPDKSMAMMLSGFGGAWAQIHDPMKQPGSGAEYPRADGKTLPLALCAAFARAMAAQAEEAGS